MLGKLTPCGGGPPILLLKPKLLVGRQRDCDIPLCFPSVSARHCELELLDGYWTVRDLGSTNGTLVNGTACTTGRLLPNDVLGVARYRYTVVYTPPAGKPPPAKAAPAPGAAERPPPAPARVVAERRQENAGGARSLGKLVPCGGGQPIPLLQPRLLVGRDAACDVVLRSSGVSGRHCQLEWADGCWSVRDLGSKNGIRVDGVRCESQRLPPGSVLWVGGLRFEVVYTAPGAAPRSDAGPLFSQSLLEKAGLARWRPPAPSPRDRGKAGDEDEQPRRYTLDDSP
jgi:adenylate cyclase